MILSHHELDILARTHLEKRRDAWLPGLLAHQPVFVLRHWQALRSMITRIQSTVSLHYVIPGVLASRDDTLTHAEFIVDNIAEIMLAHSYAVDYTLLAWQQYDQHGAGSISDVLSNWIKSRCHRHYQQHQLSHAEIDCLLPDRNRLSGLAFALTHHLELHDAYARVPGIWPVYDLLLQALAIDEQTAAILRETIKAYLMTDHLVIELRDWKQDVEQSRPSVILAQTALRMGHHKQLSLQETSTKAFKVVFYTECVIPAFAMLQDIVATARKQLQPLPHFIPWKHRLNYLQNYLYEQHKLLAALWQAPQPRRRQHLSSDIPQMSRDAIRAGQDYLLGQQAADGYWLDFMNSAGMSNIWVTGYVGHALLQTDGLPADALKAAVAWLERYVKAEGGWGYNPVTPLDADSTAWVLRFLKTASRGHSLWEQASNVLQEHQDKQGWFSTYNDTPRLRDYLNMGRFLRLDGWCGPTDCVTAVALLALQSKSFSENSISVTHDTGYNYLIRKQTDAGYWNAYWWCGPYYTTAHVLEGLAQAGMTTHKAYRKSIHWLQSAQDEDGAWRVPQFEEAAFYTGLALKSLTLESSQVPHVERATRWLLTQQQQDGSWKSGAHLLMPPPHETEPRVNMTSLHEQVNAIDCYTRDYTRCFTTATVIMALNQALKQRVLRAKR